MRQRILCPQSPGRLWQVVQYLHLKPQQPLSPWVDTSLKGLEYSQEVTVPCSKTQRSCLSGYYSIHYNTRIKSQGCFGILSSLAFQWALKLCDYHQK